MSRRVIVVVNHFPGDGRLSGLVSFARALVPALADLREVKVFCGSRGDVAFPGGDRVGILRINPFFWLRVWARVRESTDDVVVLSGIHSPTALTVVAWLMRIARLQGKRILYVQAVTLDRQLTNREAARLASAASSIAFLNPFEARRNAEVLPGSICLKSGIDSAVLGIRPEKTQGATVRIGFFGHLNRVKGADRLPSILGSLPPGNWDCVIAGSGELSADLDSWIAGQRAPIQLHGYLKDPFELLRSCDLLVAPFRQSNTVLGISQVVLEALALGIPVVGTKVEAISAAITDGANGLLRDTDSQIAEALGLLIADQEMRKVLSVGAIEAASQYSIQKTAIQAISLLEAVRAGNSA